jgi:Flp pilus assembly pilin Flp
MLNNETGGGSWGPAGTTPLDGTQEAGVLMNTIRKLYVKADSFARGQTMAEYALILAAVAVVAFAGYQTMGTTLTTLLSSVDTKL